MYIYFIYYSFNTFAVFMNCFVGGKMFKLETTYMCMYIVLIDSMGITEVFLVKIISNLLPS